MLLPEQLRFSFNNLPVTRQRDPELESAARELLHAAGARRISALVRVEWNSVCALAPAGPHFERSSFR